MQIYCKWLYMLTLSDLGAFKSPPSEFCPHAFNIGAFIIARWGLFRKISFTRFGAFF